MEVTLEEEKPFEDDMSVSKGIGNSKFVQGGPVPNVSATYSGPFSSRFLSVARQRDQLPSVLAPDHELQGGLHVPVLSDTADYAARTVLPARVLRSRIRPRSKPSVYVSTESI